MVYAYLRSYKTRITITNNFICYFYCFSHNQSSKYFLYNPNSSESYFVLSSFSSGTLLFISISFSLFSLTISLSFKVLTPCSEGKLSGTEVPFILLSKSFISVMDSFVTPINILLPASSTTKRDLLFPIGVEDNTKAFESLNPIYCFFIVS